MPKFQLQESLRKSVTVDDVVCFHSHPARWWDSWKQHPDGDASCRRRIWQVGDALTIVAFTEIEDNEGMSVTNAYERLAAMTLNDYPLLELDKIVWIEHEAPQVRHKGANEEIDLVRVTGLRQVDGVWRWESQFGGEVAWRFLWKRTPEPLPELPPALNALRRWLLGETIDLLTDLGEIRAQEPKGEA